MRNGGAALLGAVTALGVCAAVVFGGVLSSDDEGSADTASTRQVAERSSSSSSNGSLAKLYASVKDGVVYVQAGQSASGSGFVISEDGYIVTNEHVVENASTFAVRIGETSKVVPATLVGADASTDLALLKVDPAQAGDLHPLDLADAKDAQVGDEVIAIGSPFGLQSTLTSGIVSALNRQIESPSGNTISGVLQTDAAINPGNSGGPLLNADGKVIGVNAQIASQSGGNTGVGFAISVDTVKSVIPKLKAGGGTQAQPQDPFGLQEQDPYGQQPDPYGQPQPDPYGQSSPYGQDPYGSTDPYGQATPDGGYVVPGLG